jgi:pimeloyl-ACP methyl ester carboxylesterase
MPDFLSSAQTLAETLPGSSHQVIAGAGHLAPLERPAAFRSLLEQFLTSVDRR